MTDTDKPADYETPQIVDYGDFAALTQHHPTGDPLHQPLPDPHMVGSLIDHH